MELGRDIDLGNGFHVMVESVYVPAEGDEVYDRIHNIPGGYLPQGKLTVAEVKVTNILNAPSGWDSTGSYALTSAREADSKESTGEGTYDVDSRAEIAFYPETVVQIAAGDKLDAVLTFDIPQDRYVYAIGFRPGEGLPSKVVRVAAE